MHFIFKNVEYSTRSLILGHNPLRSPRLRRALGSRARGDGQAGLRTIVGQYVGDRGGNASQYHDKDFDWEDCVLEGEQAIQRQRLEREQFLASNHTATDVDTASMLHLVEPDVSQYSFEWEEFHQVHSAGRFFKEKRYLTLEFPSLLEPGADAKKGLHIAEIGCGCGSALLPILKSNPNAIATACDVSSTAVEVFQEMCTVAGIDSGRLQAFAHAAGASQTSEDSPFFGLDADFMLLIFTLSAFHPRSMPQVVSEAAGALRNGGKLLFRDYGLYDMAQIRFPGKQLIDPDHMVYQRAEGTLSYFFSVEFLKELMRDSGLSCEECHYVTTTITNRKNGKKMKRVFIHGVFTKPY